MSSIDLDTLFQHIIGSERFFKGLAQDAATNAIAAYPPTDIIRNETNDEYIIRLAVAGFKLSEISVTMKENKLFVVGKKSERPALGTFVRHGIAQRNFNVSYQLAEHIVVDRADLIDGILSIKLSVVVPEAKLPRQIPIISGEKFETEAK